MLDFHYPTMLIKFGTAGIGPVKDVEGTFAQFKEDGIQAAEIPFTYGIFITKKSVALEIKKAAEKNNIQLTIHAPYWINLNSAEPEKVKASKQRIIKCLEVGTWLSAKNIVFHPGYYGKSSKEEAYEKIKQEILDIQKIRKQKHYTPELAPETTGKINVFGKEDEILKLVEDTGCGFCIDFAHLYARNKGKISYKEMYEKVKKFKTLHCHFSGIEFGPKGERAHKRTPEKELKKLLKIFPKSKKITIINESPNPVADALLGLKIYKSL